MKTLLATILLLLTGFAGAAEAPITRGEASAVFSKLDKTLREVLHISKRGKPFKSGSGVATRDEILSQFSNAIELVRPIFRVTTVPQLFDRTVLTLKSPASRALAERLTRAGFVDPYGALIRSSSSGLTPDELGEAVGYFLSRVAEATHTPNSKFSPSLQPDGS